MGNKLIGRGFNYTDFTVKAIIIFFEIRLKSLEPKDYKEKSTTNSKNTAKNKKKSKKMKQNDSSSCVVESSDNSFLDWEPVARSTVSYMTSVIILQIIVMT